MNIGESSYGRTKTLLDVGIRECDVCKASTTMHRI